MHSSECSRYVLRQAEYCILENASLFGCVVPGNALNKVNLSGFRIRIFFPGKNLHADPDPDPGGIRGRGLGVKGKNEFFFSFFHVSDDS